MRMALELATPLHHTHVELGARMTEFGGWSMPLVYSAILAEHMQVRRRCGLFDVSHMGRFTVQGPEAQAALSALIPTNLAGLAVGRAVYTVFLNDQGGILDDLIIYRRNQGYLLVVNAGNRTRDWGLVEGGLVSGATAQDVSDQTCLLALQGPLAFEVLRALDTKLTDGAPPESIPHFASAEGVAAGIPVTIMRTGYTGEDGVEIMCAAADVQTLWDTLLAAEPEGSVLPCGLGARDTLRLEAALPLYGQDIDETTSPFMARLGRIVHLDKGPFVGREALVAAQERGPEELLVGLSPEGRSLLRHGDTLMEGGALVGRITSGSFSPVLQKPIALGYVVPPLAEVGTPLEVESRGRRLKATVVARPFYRRGVTPLPPEN